MNKLCEATGKRCFSSPSEAKSALRALRRGSKIRVYHCTECHFFHFTSIAAPYKQPKKETK